MMLIDSSVNGVETNGKMPGRNGLQGASRGPATT
jgi:hypothetical protein